MNEFKLAVSKEDFIAYIGYIERCWDIANELRDFTYANQDILDDMTIPVYGKNIDIIVQILTSVFDCRFNNELGTSELEWWIYDTNFGHKFKEGMIVLDYLPKDHKYYKPMLDTAAQLYDYLVFRYNERHGDD